MKNPPERQEALEKAGEAGLPLDVWTVNETEDLERCLGWGVAGITTDRPDRAHALLTGT